MISNQAVEFEGKERSPDERRVHLEQLLESNSLTQPAIGRTHRVGIDNLDDILGQGLRSGQVVEWFGSFSCGKTGLLRGLIGDLRKQGVAVAWIDSERALLAADWCEERPGPLWILRPPSPQDALFCTEAVLRTQSFGLVVMDSKMTLRRNTHLRLQRLARLGGAALVMLRGATPTSPGIWKAQKRIRVVSCTDGPDAFNRRGPLRWRVNAQDLRSQSGVCHDFLLTEPRSHRLTLGRPMRDRSGQQSHVGERYGR